MEADQIEATFFGHGNHIQQYLISVYYSVLMMKPNEIGPRTNDDTLVCAIILIIDLIVAANIYGEVAVLVQMAGRRSAKFQRQIDNANTAMKDMHIGKHIMQSVREFLVLIQATREQQEELNKFYTMISPSLKERVAVQIFTDILKKNKGLKEVVNKRMEEMKKKSFTLSKKI